MKAGGTAPDFGANPFNPDAPGNKEFKLVPFDDITLDDKPAWIVEDLIPCHGLVLIWGPPKCGKSFFAFDLTMHVAQGREYRGRRVEQGTVVYLAAEGAHGIRARVEAFRRERMNGERNTPFYLLTARLDMAEDIDELVSSIKRRLPDQEIKIIVIDTLNRTIHGSENKDEDMSVFVQAAERLQSEFSSTVLIVHHCGTNENRPRGHTSLTGAIDAQLAVKREADKKTIVVTVELMKDGPEGDVLACQLSIVEVGADKNGKPITSCVVEHLDAPEQRERGKKKLSAGQKRALEMLHEAIIAAGSTPPGSTHIPAGKSCVREELWQEYCRRGGISRSGPDAQRKAFERASDTLIGDHVVGTWDGWVWVI